MGFCLSLENGDAVVLADAVQKRVAVGTTSFADHLGPWMAEDSAAARPLLHGFLARSSRETLIVDCLTANAVALELLRTSGFSYARTLTRMVRGPNDYPGKPDTLCAILGPEFG